MPILISPTLTSLSEKDYWQTPPSIFNLLNYTYGPFNLDVAADEWNTYCYNYFGPHSALYEDALTAPSWNIFDGTTARAFCNPPYSRGMVAAFVRKAHSEAETHSVQTTLLVPASVDQPWWNQLVWDNANNKPHNNVDLYFFSSRIKFLRIDGTPAGSPNFASVAVTFRAK